MSNFRSAVPRKRIDLHSPIRSQESKPRRDSAGETVQYFRHLIACQPCFTIKTLPILRVGRECVLTATSGKDKPKLPLDEVGFQHLLEAAYVLQEHTGKSSPPAPPPRSPDPLAEIVETQRLIHTGALDLQSACGLIAARVYKITHCGSALAGTIEDGQWTFRAVVGEATDGVGSRVPAEDTLVGHLSGSGATVDCSDVSKNGKLNPELCKALGVRSFISVAVAHEGRAAGFLELRYEKVNAFSQQDVRTAELMAGLLGEAIARAVEQEWRQSLTAERTNMLQVLDAIKPQLDRLAQPVTVPELPARLSLPPMDLPKVNADVSPVVSEPPKIPPASVGANRESTSHVTPAGVGGESSIAIDLEALLKDPFAPPSENRVAADANGQPDKEAEAEEWQPIAGSLCRGCGTPFTQEEFFCGGCGLALFAPEDFATETSARTSLWHLHVQAEKEAAQAGISSMESSGDMSLAQDQPIADLPEALQALFEKFSGEEMASETDRSPASLTRSLPASVNPLEESAAANLEARPSEAITLDADARPAEESQTAVPAREQAHVEEKPVWKSVAETQQWLESLPQARKASWITEQWRAHKANVYLLVSAALLLGVIAGWGNRPEPSSGPGHATAVSADEEQPAAQLTWFEKALVSFGLAEPPPPAAVYAGNPDTRVWEDLHTAIYYCSGTPSYGKTASGRFVSQRTAQQDHFEPANREACE